MREDASAAGPEEVPLSVLGGMALFLRQVVPCLAKELGPVNPMLERIGAGRSQSFEMRDRLRDLIPSVLHPPGRPQRTPAEETSVLAVMEACFDYAARHPGAVSVKTQRQRYSEGYRRFVVALTAPGGLAENLSAVDLARASRVPLGTLKNWLSPPPEPGGGLPKETVSASNLEESGGETGEATHGRAAQEEGENVSQAVRDARLRQVLALWEEFSGAFSDFCRMVREEYRLPFSDTFIGDFLQAAGVRSRKRRSPGQAPWSNGTYRSYFPGAQWLGDGTSIVVSIFGHPFVFNVELMLDVASNSAVGIHVSDTEDEDAVIKAYEAGVEATGSTPVAVTLDNRSSNHTPEIAQAMPGAMLIRSTLGRPESKAPIEGAFGLFQQAMPPLDLDGENLRELARRHLQMVLTAWFRGRNGRPRRRLGGRSPAQAYRETTPSQEEIDRATRELRERQRRREKAFQTLRSRRDPARVRLLTEGLSELGISDVDHNLATQLAYFSREAITHGLAAFRVKRDLGTLPPDADAGRYLGGIIRKDHEKREILLLSEYLLEQRLRLRDFSLDSLNCRAKRLRSSKSICELPQSYVDLALQAEFEIDFRFWTRTAAEALAALPAGEQHRMYRHLGRVIASSFNTDKVRRAALVDGLASAVALAA